ncbi:hypothetical protein OIO90_003567 [Microbotryomycetes sp. JL221]|nr:hypothetical protein OIO90_003567 [Microbotryomycetes sp. JL221]
MDDSQDEPKVKRTRLACACDRCRLKKIRCDELQPSCTPCVKAKVECVVSKPSANSLVAPVRRKTGPGRSKHGNGDSRDTGPHAASSTVAGSSASGAGPAYTDSTGSPASPESVSDRHRQPANVRGPATLAHLLQAAEQPEVSTSTSFDRTASHYADRKSLSSANALASTSSQPERSSGTKRQANGLTATAAGRARFTESGILHNVDDRRKFVGASSSQALLKWLDMESSGSRLASHLTHGMQSTEQFIFPGLDDPEDNLPDTATLNHHVDVYFRHHFAWPFLDEAATRQLAQQPRAQLDPVEKALLHALIAVAADLNELTGVATEEGERHLRHAWRALPSLISRTFRSSVQTILLMILALRNRSKDGLAWSLSAMAVRIAFSYGMHLKGAGPLAALDARIWFTCYCIDKVCSFEAGRPSAIDDRACVIRPSAIGSSATFSIPGYKYPVDILTVYSTLCQQAEAIATQLFTQLSSSLTIEEALRRIGERDAALTRWAESVPLELRPGNDPPTPNALLPYTTMIHHLYHHLLITLHRLSLFDHAKLVLPELTKTSLLPYAGRLQNSISICLNSARSTLSALERVSTHLPQSRCWTLHPVFTAIIVLAIHTWQFPATWQARADLAILEHATAFAAEVFTRVGFPKDFVDVLPRMFRKTKDKVDQPMAPSRPASRFGSPEAAGIASHAQSAGSSRRPSTFVGPSSNTTGQVVSTGNDTNADEVTSNPFPIEPGATSDALQQLQQHGMQAPYNSFSEDFGPTVGWDGSIVQHEFSALWPYLIGSGGWPSMSMPTNGSNDNDTNDVLGDSTHNDVAHDMFLLPNANSNGDQPSKDGQEFGDVPGSLMALAEGVTAHGPIQGDLMFDPGFLEGSSFA